MIAVVAAVAALAASPLPLAPPTLPPVPVSGDLVRPGFAFDATARAGATRISVSVTDPDKTVATYAGIALADVLHAAGANVGDAVRGPAARAYVVVRASDGYVAVFSLAELQGKETHCEPILADTRDGRPLDAATGPVRVVAPCDLTHARSVRGVVSLAVVVVPGADMTPAHAH